jgi:hypothetical protein
MEEVKLQGQAHLPHARLVICIIDDARYVAEYDMRFPLIACFIGDDYSIVVGSFSRDVPEDLLARHIGSGGKLQPLNARTMSGSVSSSATATRLLTHH